MKMKIQMLAMLFVAALAFVACSDDDKDGIKVPDVISKALQTKYPSATAIEWEQKGAYFVADCRLDGKDANVWFNATGEWQLTELDAFWENLPESVQTAFVNGPYKNWTREGYDVLEYPLQPMAFVIEVEDGKTEYQLFYSENGDLIDTKNVTGKDDTHWPDKR